MWKTPWCSASSVNSHNQCSMRFNDDEDVRVKSGWNLGWLFGQASAIDPVLQFV